MCAKYSMILRLCLIVLSIQVSSGQQNVTSDRQPYPADRTSLSQPIPTQLLQFMPSNNPTTVDPCAPYKPPVPNFWEPGRRVSEVKCYEYIWQLKLRDEKSKRWKKCQEIRPAPGIIGGQPTKPGQFPNMVAIGWKLFIGTWKFMCGGSLISNRFVLTAAHCSRASELDTTLMDTVPKIARLGSRTILDRDNNGIPAYDVKIVQIIVHPKYKSPKQYFDIALMKLDFELIFNAHIQPACLWTKLEMPSFSQQAEVTGWGVVESGSLKTSNELLTATVDIIDSTVCEGLLRSSCNRNWCGLDDHQMCAGKLKGGVDACQGDSGGPLQVKIPLPITSQGSMNYVIGVTSFGIGCGLPGLPGVYTRVASFLDWIEPIVWPVPTS